VPYHWLVGGETLLYYINVGRVRSLEPDRIVWDDYAVDVLRWPDGRVEVVDEDELLVDADTSIIQFVAAAKERLLGELDDVVESVGRRGIIER
jgi:predicted RNA-binding protein associated with RNAse of E/G family